MKLKIKNILLRVIWIFNQYGFNPITFLIAVKRTPVFFKNYFLFKKHVDKNIPIYVKPCLEDLDEESGAINTEYFWQDLIIAQSIFQNKPKKHVDIGSRIDGFVSNVASFREIEVLDIRPINRKIPGVTFIQSDLMQELDPSIFNDEGYCDSLSCLHAIEHFGLGRYGDPIDPVGYRKGFINMTKLLKKGGIFYFATPIGKNRVEYNANWVFDPNTILELAKNTNLSIQELKAISSSCEINDIELNQKSINNLSNHPYHLGVFTFIKN
jgi:hypothetical protein